MTTSENDKQPDPEDPKKKGGGDGDAKSAVPKPHPGKQHDETSSSEEPPESDVRSRKITSSRT